MKLLVAGDWHGNFRWAKRIIEHAVEINCDAIVQLGDLGWWPHVDWGEGYIAAVDAKLIKHNLPCYFIDGNHDNHEMLPINEDGFQGMGEQLIYVPRGTHWEWEGVRFAALGGAYSIDKHRRTPGSSWWADEMIREQDIRKAITDSSGVDVLFTHDAPYPVRSANGYKDDLNSQANQRDVHRVMTALQPRWLFHGHWHHYALKKVGRTFVVGLDMDGSVFNALPVVLNQGEVTVTFPIEPQFDRVDA